jgi:hypothetical protein
MSITIGTTSGLRNPKFEGSHKKPVTSGSKSWEMASGNERSDEKPVRYQWSYEWRCQATDLAALSAAIEGMMGSPGSFSPWDEPGTYYQCRVPRESYDVHPVGNKAGEATEISATFRQMIAGHTT